MYSYLEVMLLENNKCVHHQHIITAGQKRKEEKESGCTIHVHVHYSLLKYFTMGRVWPMIM